MAAADRVRHVIAARVHCFRCGMAPYIGTVQRMLACRSTVTPTGDSSVSNHEVITATGCGTTANCAR